MVAHPQPPHRDVQHMTRDEYLAFERTSDTKHEFINGEVVAMTGGTPNHSLIIANTIRHLGNLLEASPCIVYSADLNVYVQTADLHTYPDVTVVCDDAIYTEDGYSLTNPTLLVEVLSPTTEPYDRGKKFKAYQQLPSLQAYLLVSQSEALIESFTRQGDGWFYHITTGVDAALTLTTPALTLALAEVYQKVTFADDDDDTADTATHPTPEEE